MTENLPTRNLIKLMNSVVDTLADSEKAQERFAGLAVNLIQSGADVHAKSDYHTNVADLNLYANNKELAAEIHKRGGKTSDGKSAIDGILTEQEYQQHLHNEQTRSPAGTGTISKLPTGDAVGHFAERARKSSRQSAPARLI